MLNLLLYIGCLILGSGLLYFGAEFLVKGGVIIGYKIGISSLVIGLTLIAAATSAPEMVVSINAAIQSQAEISLGNIVGSNICNIALILGLCATITPLTVHPNLLKLDTPVMIGSVLFLSLFFIVTGGVSRIAGGILFGIFISYMFYSVYKAKQEDKKNRTNEPVSDESITKQQNQSLILAIFLAIIGLTFLILGAKSFLYGSVEICELFGLSHALIGLTVVAVGTSLPELATSVVAAIKGERDIAVGNVVGSNIFNTAGILGITPLIQPLINVQLGIIDMVMMLTFSILLFPFMKTGNQVNRIEGAILLTGYIIYTTYLILKEMQIIVF